MTSTRLYGPSASKQRDNTAKREQNPHYGHHNGLDAGAGDSILGDNLPAHARPTVARALLASSVWLALWLMPVFVLIISLGAGNVFSQIAIFFSKMAVVTFGGAYAVLAYVAQQAVETYAWLEPGEMLDGLGMAETTPGPLIMVLQFVGFMAAFRDPGALSRRRRVRMQRQCHWSMWFLRAQ